jgi:hypothetical protein
MGAIGYRLYLLITGGTILAFCLTCSVTAFWLEPVSEDLARIGAYAENNYGWNGEQTRFVPPLAAVGKLGQAYDVVVVGDSFSISEKAVTEPPDEQKTHWTDFLVARTGLSVGSFHRDSVTLETYLASDGFLKAPPKLLVLEYAERTLQWAPSGTQCATLTPKHVGVVPVSPSPAQPQSFGRNRSHGIDTHRIDSAIDFLRKNVPRWIAGLNVTTVSNHRLSRTDLFTSRNNGQLLVYEDDFAKAHMSNGFDDIWGLFAGYPAAEFDGPDREHWWPQHSKTGPDYESSGRIRNRGCLFAVRYSLGFNRHVDCRGHLDPFWRFFRRQMNQCSREQPAAGAGGLGPRPIKRIQIWAAPDRRR